MLYCGVFTVSRLESIIEDEHRRIAGAGEYLPGRRYSDILKMVLGPGEHVVLGAVQSRLETLAPGIMIATNKKILVMKPSFWSLYLGHNIMRPSFFTNIHYNKITETTLYNGVLFCSLAIRISGGGEFTFDGVKRHDATRMIGFLERIAAANEGESGL